MSEIIITAVSKQEIKKLIEDAVQKIMIQKQNPNEDQTSTFMDIRQASEFLGIAKATLYGKCSKRLISHIKRGRKLYFLKQDPVSWMGGWKTKNKNGNRYRCKYSFAKL